MRFKNSSSFGENIMTAVRHGAVLPCADEVFSPIPRKHAKIPHCRSPRMRSKSDHGVCWQRKVDAKRDEAGARLGGSMVVLSQIMLSVRPKRMVFDLVDWVECEICDV
jgi:hypothetical protein